MITCTFQIHNNITRNAGDIIVHTTGACSMELPKMAAVIKNRNFFI
jgi:hypothetical protein